MGLVRFAGCCEVRIIDWSLFRCLGIGELMFYTLEKTYLMRVFQRCPSWEEQKEEITSSSDCDVEG